MTIDATFTTWLADQSAIRCMLVEVGVAQYGIVNGASTYTETTRYLSSTTYVTGPNETPANVAYDPFIVGGIRYEERMAVHDSDQASLNVGDLELININGDLDSWFNDVWVNRPIKVYLGDSQWARSQFRLIFSGIVDNLYSRTQNRINIVLRDKLQLLNDTLSEVTIASTDITKDAQPVPITFGEAHNVTPLFINAGTLQYKVHAGQIESLIEVRDNGVPVACTYDPNLGTFNLSQASFGQITASVQGDKSIGYRTDIYNILAMILSGYGKVENRLGTSDLDLSNLIPFANANQQQVGFYADGRTNRLQCCQQLAASVGAQVTFDRLGRFRILQLGIPMVTSSAAIQITPEHMVEKSLTLVDRTEVKSAIKLAYCKNWTVQEDLQTAILDDHKAMFATEWLYVTKKDTTIATTYKVTTEPEPEETLLLVKTDADTEAQRRLSFWSTPHRIFRFEGFAPMLDLELGQNVGIMHPRYNLQNGAAAMVVSLSPDWLNARVTVEVLV